MAVKRAIKKQTETASILEIPADSDLPLRIKTIAEQTGLSPLNLFQKWVLQEEAMIGLMRHVEAMEAMNADAEQQQISGAQKRKEPQKATETSPADNKNDHKALLKRAQKLQKSGMTLRKIADIFNEENLPTLSGKGKWHASALVRFLKSKI
jgi:hypothetical protein